MKVHENAITKTRKEIENIFKNFYNESEAKYKNDKRNLVALQLERERIELNKLKFGK